MTERNDPKRLIVPVQQFTAEMFARAAAAAYQAVCDQLNLLLAEHPEDEARLALIEAQARQFKDMVPYLGQIVEKSYAALRAEQVIADKAKRAYVLLENAVINQDESNPLVAALIQEVEEGAFTTYLLEPGGAGLRLVSKLASTLQVDEVTAQQFVDVLLSPDDLLPEHLEEALSTLLDEWRADGFLRESDVDYVSGTY